MPTAYVQAQLHAHHPWQCRRCGRGAQPRGRHPFTGWLATAAKIVVGKTAKAGRRAAKIASAAEKAAAKKAAKEAAEKAAKKSKSGAKVKAKTLPKKKPHCFDPRNAKFKKMSEAEQRKYLREYARQLKRQEAAINNMTAKQFAEARAQFDAAKKASRGNKGRNPQAKKDQEDYRRDREEKIKERIYRSNRNKKKMAPEMAEANAANRSKEIMDKLAALHEPDMVAGGWSKSKPPSLGDRDVNSAIGGSWGKRDRVPDLEKAANEALGRGDGQSKMNIELTICPPGKKGK